MKPIKLYTWRTCPFCRKAKQLLNDNGYAFEEVDILDHPEKKEELTKIYGQKTVPYVFVGEDLIGGASDLEEKLNNNTFEELLVE